MPTPRRFYEHMLLRLPAGSFRRIDAARATNQDRATFIRHAVEMALRQVTGDGAQQPVGNPVAAVPKQAEPADPATYAHLPVVEWPEAAYQAWLRRRR
jgi:hypothetical protein